MRLLIPVFVAAVLAATKTSAGPEPIEFSDLADPLAVAFDDFHKDMGSAMLSELQLLATLDQRLSDDNLAEEERARFQARRVAAQEMFKANGQDVDALLAQQWDIAKRRQTARMIGRSVTISSSDRINPPAIN